VAGVNSLCDLAKVLAQEDQGPVGEIGISVEEALVDQHGPALDLADVIAGGRGVRW
jgi:hypothetical protein